MNVGKSEIIFKYNPDKKQFCEIVFIDTIYVIRLDVKIPEDLISTFDFILDYYSANDVSKAEVLKLTEHMFSKLRYFKLYEQDDIETKYDDETISLRQIAYDNVKKTLEEDNVANLDDLTDKVMVMKYPIELRRNSVRASISSVFSALRNGFKELGVEAWNEPVWRGKSTGRNPHVRVVSPFIMPSYVLLWERYNDYLSKRSTHP